MRGVSTSDCLDVSDDGQHFTIRQFMLSLNFWWSNGTFAYSKRSVSGHSSLVLQEPDISNCIATTAMPTARALSPTLESISEFYSIFQRIQMKEQRLSAIAYLQNKRAAIFAVSVSYRYRIGVQSKVFGIRAGGEPKLLAKIPIDPVQLHVFGTRVLCYRKDGHGGKMIVFDFWNPDSVRRGDFNITEVDSGVKYEHSDE